MLHSASSLHGTLVQAIDGPGGTIEQLLFDDVTWAVRHVVVRIGRWLSSQRVLLPPSAITLVSLRARAVYVAPTRAEIAACPDICTDPPVTEQHVQAAVTRMPAHPCWCEPGLWAVRAYAVSAAERRDSCSATIVGDRHVRGTRHITGYTVAARDATFGRIADVVVDDVSWTVRSVVVANRPWWSRQVVISRDAVRSFDCWTRLAAIDMWRAAIEQSPDCRTVIQQQYAPRDQRPHRQPIS